MKKAALICNTPFLLVKCSPRGFHVQNLSTKIWMKVLVRNEQELEKYLKRSLKGISGNIPAARRLFITPVA